MVSSMAFLSTHSTSAARRSDVDAAADIVVGGDRRLELVETETKLGRHPDCQIIVEASAVSRFHAKIVRAGNDYELVDLNSRNGTFLNGVLVKQQPLRSGDRIRVGDIEFTFADGQGLVTDESQLTFSGSCFGVVMVDEEISKASQTFSSGVNYTRAEDGNLKMTATAEAKLSALLQINHHLRNSLALDEVFPSIIESLFTIFPSADRGFIVMDNDGQLATRWIKTRRPSDETQTVRISRTIIRRVIETGEAILSLDATEDIRFNTSESIADFSIRSMICAPLCDADGKVFGALQIDTAQGHGQFSQEDIDVLIGVAAQAGILINNAQMHEQAMLQRELEQDLKLATDVQKAFLPSVAPSCSGFELDSYYEAANHIGGDYFDYIQLSGERCAVVVADVVGHGIAAAMFMAKLAAETRYCLAGEADIATAVSKLNRRMCQLDLSRFVTFLLVVLDPKESNVLLVNAGHMAPIIRRGADGSICEPGEEESGLPIAIMDDSDYQAVAVDFQPGDVMLMYTDGINEAMDAQDEPFGIEAIRELAKQDSQAGAVKQRVVNAVKKHVGDLPPTDDQCLVVIQRA
jgi:serine phosphatase RsbU (regulator of sigma subunit)